MTAQTFAFRLPEELMSRLRRAALVEGTSAGDIIRRGVSAELDRIALTRLAREVEERSA